MEENYESEPSLMDLPSKNKDYSLLAKNRFKELRPKKYEDKITMEYLSMLKHKEYEKSYQQCYFNQAIEAEYSAYDPWYCLSELLAKGGEYIIT